MDAGETKWMLQTSFGTPEQLAREQNVLFFFIAPYSWPMHVCVYTHAHAYTDIHLFERGHRIFLCISLSLLSSPYYVQLQKG